MKTKLSLIYAITLVLMVACSDDETAYTCKSCTDTPEASAANDNSGQGIYKGLVVGSSGTIKFDIANSGSGIVAVLTMDGEEYELVTQATYNSETGLNGTFTNANAGISIGFSVSASGFPQITSIVIPGHPNATIELYKEKSNSLVRVFEGTFSGDASGVFNLVTRGEQWIVIAKPTGADSNEYCSGYIVNETLTSDCDITITGTVKGDIVTGNWDSGDGDNGSWKGKRTL